jgi:hypothetical protein
MGSRLYKMFRHVVIGVLGVLETRVAGVASEVGVSDITLAISG